MKFSGYWVTADAGKIFLEKTNFDETDLDPETNWKQAWQNQDSESKVKGYVQIEEALMSAAESLAKITGYKLSQTELDQAAHFNPVWHDTRCEIQSLSAILDSSSCGSSTYTSQLSEK